MLPAFKTQLPPAPPPHPPTRSYSGVPYSQDAVRIVLGDMVLMDAGQPLAFDEAAASAYLKAKKAEHGTVNIQVGGAWWGQTAGAWWGQTARAWWGHGRGRCVA